MSQLRGPVVAGIALLAAVGLVGCGEKKQQDKPASQTAAKVNKEEITVHQINFVLQQQRGVAPDQAASAGKLVLERLIDQELAVQKAQEQKLDRDPAVVQQIEAARREIIARAYVDRVATGAPKATPAEVKAYYDAHPALFKERRVYSLQEIAFQLKPDQVGEIKAKLSSSKNLQDFMDYLKTKQIKYAASQAVRPAEQLPLSSLEKLAQMKDGQTILNFLPGDAAQVVMVAGSRNQPVDEARAAPAIEQFLRNERKRKMIADDLKALRSAAKVTYVGDYVKVAGEASAPAPAASESAAFTPLTPAMPGGTVPAAPQMEVESVSVSPASAPASGALEKGLTGLKGLK